jgi:hypothetical protein
MSTWRPGQSGNPAGRPRGSGEVAKARALIAKSIEDKIPALITKLAERALEGDTGAARLLLERIIPPMKQTEEATPIELGPGSLTEQGESVLQAIAGGAIAPSQGAAVLAALGALSKLREGDELERRIAALEAKTCA